MDTVWVVTGGFDYESSTIIGVFSTKNFAEDFISKHLTTDYKTKEDKDYYDFVEINDYIVINSKN